MILCMDGDPFLPSRGARVLRVLTASFRLGRILGVELRVYWLALVILPAIVAFEAPSGSPILEVLVLAVLVTGLLYLVTWSHEMGHVLAGRRYGIATPRITLSPLGGLAHLEAAPPGPRADLVVSLAGPAVHLLWLAVAWPLSHAVTSGVARPAGWVAVDPVHSGVDLLVWMNVSLLGFNLLPFFPMDGGRVVRALLSLRMHPNRAQLLAARLGMAGAVALAIAGLVLGRLWGGILLAIGVTNFFACRHAVRAARYGEGPYFEGAPREAWADDPDAWKRGAGGAEVVRPGPLARWREGRAAHREVRRLRDAERLDEAVDRVLDRVNEVGMAGLTPEERRILERASRARRDRR
jgi:Zn-dependent protease